MNGKTANQSKMYGQIKIVIGENSWSQVRMVIVGTRCLAQVSKGIADGLLNCK